MRQSLSPGAPPGCAPSPVPAPRASPPPGTCRTRRLTHPRIPDATPPRRASWSVSLRNASTTCAWRCQRLPRAAEPPGPDHVRAGPCHSRRQGALQASGRRREPLPLPPGPASRRTILLPVVPEVGSLSAARSVSDSGVTGWRRLGCSRDGLEVSEPRPGRSVIARRAPGSPGYPARPRGRPSWFCPLQPGVRAACCHPTEPLPGGWEAGSLQLLQHRPAGRARGHCPRVPRPSSVR